MRGSRANGLALIVYANLPKPPTGMIDSLRMGFETLVGQPALLTPPLILDVVLWIGPRLSIRAFALPAVERFFAMLPAQPADMPDVMQAMADLKGAFEHLAAHFNALSALVTGPLGVPSLIGRLSPDATPAGIAPPMWELSNIWTAMVVMIALALVGFLLGAAYLGLIANQVHYGEMRARDLLRALPRHWINLAALALILLSTLVIVAVPFWCLASVLGMLSPLLGFLAMTVGLSIGLWVLVFMVFAVPAMLLNDRALFPAIVESARVVRLHASSTFLFLLLAGLIYGGTGIIFRLPTPDSWLIVAGLALHAFVATALFMAAFIFYQDRYRHYQEFYAYLAESRRAMTAGGQRGREN